MTGWHKGPMTPFDTESTGLNLEEDRIVSATVVVMRPGAGGGKHEVDIRSHLIAVDIDIDPAAVAVHGITTEYAREHGKPAADVLDLVANDLAMSLRAGVPVVGMNLSFDWTLLDRECRRWGVPTVGDRLDGNPIAPVLDVLVIDKAIDKFRKGKRKLTDLCEFYQVRIDGAHDATFDALAAARIAYRMGQRSQMDAQVLCDLYADRRFPGELARSWQALGRMDLTDLHVAQTEWYREQSEDLGKYWRKEANQKRHEADLARSDADMDPTDGDAAAAIAAADVLEQEAAELDARVASLSPYWPLRPFGAVAR